MERYFEMLEEMWVYYFSSLDMEYYEYDIYGKIIDKIRKKEFDFTKDDKDKILNMLIILMFKCDEYEIKIIDKIKEIIKV